MNSRLSASTFRARVNSGLSPACACACAGAAAGLGTRAGALITMLWAPLAAAPPRCAGAQAPASHLQCIGDAGSVIAMLTRAPGVIGEAGSAAVLLRLPAARLPAHKPAIPWASLGSAA